MINKNKSQIFIKKIHTTDSTSTYLKKWSRDEDLQNFTIIIAEEQTAGRGQRENKWISEKGKNLTFSILIRLDNFEVSRQFELNKAVSLGLIMALKEHVSNNTNTKKFSPQIKWPNDILVSQKKIAGILIENTLSGSKLKQSVVGIGLNVNQINFPDTLSNASSLQLLIKKQFDLDILLQEIVFSIQSYVVKLEQNNNLQQEYLKNLYFLGVRSKFKDKDRNEFIGEIMDVKADGKLEIKTQSGMLRTFYFKEISFVD